jgi:hypothetical protein
LGAGLFSQTWGVREASVQVITEWLPVDVGDGQQVVMLLIGVVGLTLSVRARNTLAVALLLVLIAGSVLAMRLLPLLVLVSVPAIAASLSRPRVEAFLRSRRVVLVPGAVTAVLALLALASSAMTHLGRPLPDLYPQQVVHDIPPGCRLFNSYTLGGFVILTRPDVLVSIDSRNDLYGADRVAANTHAVEAGQMHHPDLQRAGCVLVPPDTRLALALSADNAWTLTASERAAVLFTRRG